jgi:hypothetical protein
VIQFRAAASSPRTTLSCEFTDRLGNGEVRSHVAVARERLVRRESAAGASVNAVLMDLRDSGLHDCALITTQATPPITKHLADFT